MRPRENWEYLFFTIFPEFNRLETIHMEFEDLFAFLKVGEKKLKLSAANIS